MNKLHALLLTLIGLITIGCQDVDPDSGSGGETHDITQTVSGKVEKGPFVSGSILELRTLNGELNPTGKSFVATIEDNAGNFSFGTISADSQFAKLTAEGYFFNEVAGKLSESTIYLNAIVDLSDSKSVNVNIFTHLMSQRIVELVKQGSNFADARATARDELMKAFALQNLKIQNVEQITIAEGSDAAAALIAVSSIILCERSEAEIVEFISLLSTEFASLGAFRPETKEILRKNRNGLNDKFSEIAENVKQRYAELGHEVEVKDLSYYFDWNDDGIAGNELESDVKLSTTEINAPSVGGHYTVEILSDVEYYLSIPENVKDGFILEENSPSVDFGSGLYDSAYQSAEMLVESYIENNVITIDVAPAEFRCDKSLEIPLYNARGEGVASIKVAQQGDPSLPIVFPNLGENGRAFFSGILYTLSYTYSELMSAEWNFIQSQGESYLMPNSGSVADIWSGYYEAIAKLVHLKQIDAEQDAVYQDIINTYLAVVYTTMMQYWGDLIFYTDYKSPDELMALGRTPKSEVINALLALTEPALETLPETAIDFHDANSTFQLSKDVVRVMRAQLLMEAGDHGSALTLLEDVIGSGRYRFDSRPEIIYTTGPEAIFVFLESIVTRSDVLVMGDVQPLYDLKELYMAAAECAIHSGDMLTANRYIDDFCSLNSVPKPECEGIKRVQTIKNMLYMPCRIPCMRRAGCGYSAFELPQEQWYKMLWPIPEQELRINPNITQNPGY